MKNYDQMANDVLRRIDEQNSLLEEKRENRRKAMPKVIAASIGCVCVVAILGVVAWQTGLMNFNKGVYIPRAEIAIEQPAVSNGEKYKYDSNGLSDKMYYSHEASKKIEPYIEYEGRIYRILGSSSEEVVDLDKSLGKVNDENSQVHGYIVNGEVFPMKNRDESFQLCVRKKLKFSDGEERFVYYSYICNNDITLKTGKDWFEKRLRLKSQNKIKSATYWRENVDFVVPPRLDEKGIEKFNEFMEVLYDSPFIYCEDEDVNKIVNETEIRGIIFYVEYEGISFKDKVYITLIEGGYVQVDGLQSDLVCIKMDDPVFNEMMNMLY